MVAQSLQLGFHCIDAIMAPPCREVVSSVQPKVCQPSPQPPWNYGAKGGSPSPYRLVCFKVFTLYEWFDCQYVTKISRNLI